MKNEKRPIALPAMLLISSIIAVNIQRQNDKNDQNKIVNDGHDNFITKMLKKNDNVLVTSERTQNVETTASEKLNDSSVLRFSGRRSTLRNTQNGRRFFKRKLVKFSMPLNTIVHALRPIGIREVLTKIIVVSNFTIRSPLYRP
ncbi:hypothetical protein Tcan_15352 [Toxocara canis]|uniref:Uncharacterized protein n=1 Tax=Toxocara canis TaxID=6265 RepID=A0A0B2VC04_TOXCA|nr:hypothetical protein Tcan_15352 [Toxocara canis]